MSFKDMLNVFLHKEADTKVTFIMWRIRLPSAIMAVNIGIALGLSGACMQTILNNPLASPYTMGVSAGAGFGAALALVTGWFSGTFLSGYATSIFAIISAMLVIFFNKFFGKKKTFFKKQYGFNRNCNYVYFPGTAVFPAIYCRF